MEKTYQPQPQPNLSDETTSYSLFPLPQVVEEEAAPPTQPRNVRKAVVSTTAGVPDTHIQPTSLVSDIPSDLKGKGFSSSVDAVSCVGFEGVQQYIHLETSHRTLPAVANAAAANLAVTGLIRVPYVVNLFYAVIRVVPPRSFPLFIRHITAEIPHFGGVYSGCGVAALFWYIALYGLVTREYVVSPPPGLQNGIALLVLMYLILCLILFILVAHPAVLGLPHPFRAGPGAGSGDPTILGFGAIPSILVAIVLTVAFFIPWLSLRKVPVTSEYLSSHAVRLHFNFATAGFAQGISVSKHPLKDWHRFAGIPNIDSSPGFSLIVSKAGDWTSAAINEQPRALWKRGTLTSGFGRNCLLFNRILLITTGSGMGPCLSLLAAPNRPPIRIWQTRSPQKTYGQEVLKMISMVDNNAVVIDSDKHGRQDMFPIAWDMVKDFNAEAVFIISRPNMVQKLVFEFEVRGIPAFGPVFDS
ncbi:hypothetical protein BP6252_14091 [Coleophoma cylindrospora]|uniref:Integral membrane protein TmpA n=1 Tax=Coleophoma cylindrospora TaxID=1849047 RepID=A0A3D8Q3Y5_9HELO|nr:hypothetical protein BP6252_14091 [Coleophoma cylindrospora]